MLTHLILIMAPLLMIMLTHLILIMAPCAELDGIEEISHLKQVDAISFGRLEHIDQSLFQPEPVGHNQIGIVQESDLGRGYPVVMRVRSDR